MIHNTAMRFPGRPMPWRLVQEVLGVAIVMVAVSAWAQTPPAAGAPQAPAGAAAAQPAPAADGDSGAPAGARTKEWVKKGSAQKVVELNFDDAQTVYGKVQKPGVDYLITQGDLKYDGLPLERNLLKELEDSVKGPPF